MLLDLSGRCLQPKLLVDGIVGRFRGIQRNGHEKGPTAISRQGDRFIGRLRLGAQTRQFQGQLRTVELALLCVLFQKLIKICRVFLTATK